MTCRELRLFFEDPERLEGKFDAESEHLARCAECARFVEQRRELRAGLRLSRMSAPTIPDSLDKAVLRDYRREIANGPVKPAARNRRVVVMSCCGAAAAIVVVAALLIIPDRRTTVTVVSPTSVRAETSRPITPTTGTNKTQAVATGRAHPARVHHPATADAAASHSVPLDFRSLIYCDELSCGGAMDVIRVQLPASAVLFSPGINSANGTVLADVVVGPDGIARGIRIVE